MKKKSIKARLRRKVFPFPFDEMETLLELEKAVYGWFYKTTDKHGDDPAKMARYQDKMVKHLKKLKKIRRK